MVIQYISFIFAKISPLLLGHYACRWKTLWASSFGFEGQDYGLYSVTLVILIILRPLQARGPGSLWSPHFSSLHLHYYRVAKPPPSLLEDHPCHHLDPPATKPFLHPHQMQGLQEGREEREAPTLFNNLISIDKLQSSGIQGSSLRLREKGPALYKNFLNSTP